MGSSSTNFTETTCPRCPLKPSRLLGDTTTRSPTMKVRGADIGAVGVGVGVGAGVGVGMLIGTEISDVLRVYLGQKYSDF